MKKGAPVLEDGRRVWKTFPDIEFQDDSFPVIGEEFRRTGRVVTGRVGSAQADLFRVREAVDFAAEWFQRT